MLAAFACLIADRDQVRAGWPRSVDDRTRRTTCTAAGVALGARWWRFGAGVLLGLTTAVKWSGAYWIVAFGVLTVIWDITARREAGIRRPVRAVVRRDLLPSLWSLGGRPVVDLHRRAGGRGSRPRPPADGTPGRRASNGLGVGALTLARCGRPVAVDEEDAGLPRPPAHPDRPGRSGTPGSPSRGPGRSAPARCSYYSPANGTGCGEGRTDCVKRIFLIGTPALWWISLFVLAWALWKAHRPAGLAVRGGPGRLRRRLPAVVRQPATGRCTSST